jgi:hypothetical protein
LKTAFSSGFYMILYFTCLSMAYTDRPREILLQGLRGLNVKGLLFLYSILNIEIRKRSWYGQRHDDRQRNMEKGHFGLESRRQSAPGSVPGGEP